MYITTYTVLSFIPVVTIPFKDQYKDFTVSSFSVRDGTDIKNINIFEV